MKKDLQTAFSTRQYMISNDFEIYYYNNTRKENINYRVQLHAHDYYEFYFFLEGDVSFLIDGTKYPVKNGNVILIPPGIFHQAMIHNAEIPYRRFVFWISKAFCRRIREESRDYLYLMEKVQQDKRYIYSYEPIAFHLLQSKIFQLIEEMHSDHFGKEAKISLGVKDLILSLNRTIFEKEHPKISKEGQSLCQNLIQYIDAHLEEDLSLNRLAHEFYSSKYYIAHLFKENFGLSVHQFITQKRLLLCRDAITGKQKISEVCQMYGFRDYSSFFALLKKEFGISPKEHRDSTQNYL